MKFYGMILFRLAISDNKRMYQKFRKFDFVLSFDFTMFFIVENTLLQPNSCSCNFFIMVNSSKSHYFYVRIIFLNFGRLYRVYPVELIETVPNCSEQSHLEHTMYPEPWSTTKITDFVINFAIYNVFFTMRTCFNLFVC